MQHKALAIPTVQCRLCASRKLTTVLSLGNQYVSDFVTAAGQHPMSPLELIRCRDCGLVQLRHTFPRTSLYQHYWYRSGISGTMREALADVALKAYEVATPSSGQILVDTGCNDGTLLRTYPKSGTRLVGFEPAENLVEDARRGTYWVFNDFFKAGSFRKKFGDEKAKIVTSVAMFYDLEDPNTFVSDIFKCLALDGVWVVQQNYLATMLQKNGFDNIGHEHLEYYSLSTMERLLSRHGLEIFDVETNNVNGGSFSNTILQYCGLDYRLIKKATDANSEKWGLRTVGTKIPIVSKEEARRDKPNYFLILPHHFLEEIEREEKDYLDHGGRFIVPLPEVRVIA